MPTQLLAATPHLHWDVSPEACPQRIPLHACDAPWTLRSNQAHKLSQALTQDAVEAVRAALQYEALHEEVDEDVGEPYHPMP